MVKRQSSQELNSTNQRVKPPFLPLFRHSKSSGMRSIHFENEQYKSKNQSRGCISFLLSNKRNRATSNVSLKEADENVALRGGVKTSLVNRTNPGSLPPDQREGT